MLSLSAESSHRVGMDIDQDPSQKKSRRKKARNGIIVSTIGVIQTKHIKLSSPLDHTKPKASLKESLRQQSTSSTTCSNAVIQNKQSTSIQMIKTLTCLGSRSNAQLGLPKKQRRKHKSHQVYQRPLLPNCDEDVGLDDNETEPSSEDLRHPLRRVPLHILLQQRESKGQCLKVSQLKQYPSFKSSVPFSRLETPQSEAVLGVDTSGQYVVALAGTDLGLALKFYGIPSRDKLEGRPIAKIPCMSPLLQTVRLTIPLQDFGHTASIADVSVQVVASRDWRVGVAIVHTPRSRYGISDNEELGNLVAFAFPSTLCPTAVIPMIPTMICVNVKIGGKGDFTMRNRLWKTNCIPVHSLPENKHIATHISNQSSYLFLHDEDDGFRLSWIADKGVSLGDLKPISDSTMNNHPTRDDIVTRVLDSSWEQSSSINAPFIQVVMEAFFHVDALVDEIRSKRRDVFHYNDIKCPDFHYRLISMSPCGRVIKIVLVFSNHVRQLQVVKKARPFPTSVGVFVQIDLFTQAYCEMEWGQCGYQLDSTSLRGWASLLAINRRMHDQRLGPFSLANCPKWVECHDWSPFLIEENSEEEPASYATWSQYLTDMKSTKIKVITPPKIPYAMLYPDADVFSNDAVRTGRPVSTLKCRSGVTELIYG